MFSVLGYAYHAYDPNGRLRIAFEVLHLMARKVCHNGVIGPMLASRLNKIEQRVLRLISDDDIHKL